MDSERQNMLGTWLGHKGGFLLLSPQACASRQVLTRRNGMPSTTAQAETLPVLHLFPTWSRSCKLPCGQETLQGPRSQVCCIWTRGESESQSHSTVRSLKTLQKGNWSTDRWNKWNAKKYSKKGKKRGKGNKEQTGQVKSLRKRVDINPPHS